ncbi:MAG TPA: TIGR04086 family membrane protein, partial [Lachnospiraceae bacterium]|nr:TIGR04086 family membrane protein [Lachnospiraceae bacterium]
MEKKTRNEHRGENKAVWILKSLLCAYIVTGILLLLLTLLLYKVNLDEGKVT